MNRTCEGNEGYSTPSHAASGSQGQARPALPILNVGAGMVSRGASKSQQESVPAVCIGSQARKRPGFVDAFNPLTGWHNADVIGIDQGISVLMAENQRTGMVGHVFKGAPDG